MVCDTKGILDKKRDYSDNKYKKEISLRTNNDNVSGGLAEAVAGANIFVGVSGPGVLKQQHVKSMADKPIIFALANPTPEILPNEAL